MKYYQLSEEDIKNLGINESLLEGREVLGSFGVTKVDIEAVLDKKIDKNEWEDLKFKFSNSQDASEADTNINTFILEIKQK